MKGLTQFLGQKKPNQTLSSTKLELMIEMNAGYSLELTVSRLSKEFPHMVYGMYPQNSHNVYTRQRESLLRGVGSGISHKGTVSTDSEVLCKEQKAV